MASVGPSMTTLRPRTYEVADFGFFSEASGPTEELGADIARLLLEIPSWEFLDVLLISKYS